MDNLIISPLDPSFYSSKKVAVAMSGGVDSSVAAALLLKAGFDVAGFTMLHLESPGLSTGQNEYLLPYDSAVKSAERTAAEIGIKHFVIDLSKEFEDKVIEYFCKTYMSGKTPNPCVVCNKAIKWGTLAEEAFNRGYDLFATGHYARIGLSADGFLHILTGIDKIKDQSYFLWSIESEFLKKTIFPLGNMKKSETKTLARRLGITVSERPESQEICFIPDNDFRKFISVRMAKDKNHTMEEGNILDKTGNIIGKHKGTAFYTVGQRRGIGYAAGFPVYVTAVDSEQNTITVSGKENLLSGAMIVKELNWAGGAPPSRNFRCLSRVRYKSPGIFCEIEINGDTARVIFDEPQSAVTPGQSAVFYKGEAVIGGGIIENSLSYK